MLTAPSRLATEGNTNWAPHPWLQAPHPWLQAFWAELYDRDGLAAAAVVATFAQVLAWLFWFMVYLPTATVRAWRSD